MFACMNFSFKNIYPRIIRILPSGFIFAVFISSFFHRCANIVPPTGGPRDTIPPRIVSSNPPLYSTNVSPSNITITFDEYIELRDLQQQFLISPPQEERPEIRQRGRALTVNLKPVLEENTTYSLNFGNAIVDLNEGNPFRNFQFVFSTGPTIDSMTIEGRVVSAFEKKPEENITVMLYPNHYDSVPMKEIPLYVTRTDKEGYFKLRHLRNDTFKFFALKDINNNYLYDRPGSEAIAFLDTLIFPTGFEYLKTPKTDNDSIKEVHDHDHDSEHDHVDEEGDKLSIQLFSPVNETKESSFGKELLLPLFTEDIAKQYISSATRPARNRLFFTFNRAYGEKPQLTPLGFPTDLPWKILETSPKNDSVIVWITDSLVLQMDTIQLEVKFTDPRPDTVLLLTDTLRFTFMAPREGPPQRGRTTDAAAQIISLNIRNREVVDLGKKISFLAASPVKEIDTSKIFLFNIIDSVPEPLDFRITQHPNYLRRFQLDAILEQDSEFRLELHPAAFKDSYGNLSDSVLIEFKSQKEINYGSLILDLKNVNDHLIIQLLDEKDNLLAEHFISNDSKIEYKYLRPQLYRLRAILDGNKNGRWDTGNYLLGIQPERIIMHAEPVTVRAAWELEHAWEIPNN